MRFSRKDLAWLAPIFPSRGRLTTDTALGVDVGVVDLCRERDLGRSEGVIGRQHDRQVELASLVRTVGRTLDRRGPLEDAVVAGSGRAAWREFTLFEIGEFTRDPLLRHSSDLFGRHDRMD